MNVVLVVGVLITGGIVGQGSMNATLVRQRVDLIELNHFVDDQGREVFQQVVFYDWSSQHRRYHVRAWRIVKQPSQLPQRFWNPRKIQCTWHDGGLMRQVVAPSMRETWTQQDPERINQKVLPEDQRLPLWERKVAEVDSEISHR